MALPEDLIFIFNNKIYKNPIISNKYSDKVIS